MRKFVLFLILFCLVMPMQVFAIAPSQEETNEESIVEMVDEVTDQETPEDNTEMFDELDERLFLMDKLDAINNNLIAIEFTLLFMVGVHYTEKWLKIALSRIKDSGRVL